MKLVENVKYMKYVKNVLMDIIYLIVNVIKLLMIKIKLYIIQQQFFKYII